MRAAVLEDELGRVIRVAERIVECNKAAEGGAEDDRMRNPEHVAERP